MRYTIGLDIGIASVGWAVINNDKSRIEDLGVRVFKKAEEADGKALNLSRREARCTRRRIRRRATRMKKVKELLVKYNLVTEEELIDLYVMTDEKKDVYELRFDALEEKIDRKDWGRVLTNIAKRRGYKSNRKTDEEDSEGGRLTKGTQENKRILEEKNYRTIGEMFYKDRKFVENKRNKGGEYNNTVLRSMLLDEIKILFEKQRNFGNNYASEEFEKEYIDIVMFQKPYITPELLERMLGKCTFENGEPRAPKNSYTFERFMLLQKVNNLRIAESGEIINITDEQRNKIIKMAYEQSEITYAQLRKKLNLSKEAKFVDLNYSQIKKKKDDMSEDEIIKEIEKIKFIKLEGYHKIRVALKNKPELFEKIKANTEKQDIIADALVRNKTDETIREYLKNKDIDIEIIEEILNINFTKFGHLSYVAMKKIIPELEKGLRYDEACENVGYDFKGKQHELQYKLPPISKLDDEVILNPVVLRAVSQTRKVINAIIDKYGSPMAIHIETARELAKSYEERGIIEAKQKANFLVNEKEKEYIKETFKFEPKPFDLVKMKLWREQNGKCAYSQKTIPAERLYEENFVQVDHIIPFSRCFNDSYNNKVLVLTDENQRKKERTPYEYFGEDEYRWHAFEEFVNSTYKLNTKKKEFLLIKKFDENKSKEWIERNLNDTKYIARFMYNYLANNLKFAESKLKRKVYNVNGQATAVLRRYWGLNKVREESDKHHAQDAVVIACATSDNIKKVSDYSRDHKLYNKSSVLKEPWPRFREEVEARMEDADNNGELYALKHGKFTNYDDVEFEKIKPIFVSRMPERKVTGRAHKDTMRSLKFMNQGENYTVVKKPLTSITKEEITNIIKKKEFSKLYNSDKAMYEDIYNKMLEAGFKAEKAFKDGYRKFSKTGNCPIVRSIKVPSSGTAGVKLKNKSLAENASMVRVDVFEKDKKYYLVPIYVSDFAKKELPNKAITRGKEEKEWTEMTEEYNFKFSLYPNDLIKIKKKNEEEFFAYYASTHRGTAAINLLEPNGKNKLEGIGVKNLEVFEKYNVDILGNISKINKEKREGVN